MLTRRRLLATAAGLSVTALAGRPALATSDGFIELRPAAAALNLLGPDRPATDLFAYNGTVPGPEIRVRQGDTVRVRLVNGLREVTTLHWHGVRLPNPMDGVPGLTQEPVPPGASFDYEFVAKDAGTYWYHSHQRSYDQVDRGLYGPLIVEEPQAIGVDRDLMLIIDDWRLTAHAQIDELSVGDRREWARQGRIGNTFTVNGLPNAPFPVRRGERVRLRCINACNASILSFYVFGLPMQVVSFDGQMLASPEIVQHEPLSPAPGQRVDFVIEIDDRAPPEIVLRLQWNGQSHAIATLAVTDEAPVVHAEPLALIAGAVRPLDLAGARRVPVAIQGGSGSTRFRRGDFRMRDHRESGQFWTLNGVSGGQHHGYGHGLPLFEANLGETVIVDMHNDNFFAHAMHLHGCHFAVVERNGQPVPAPFVWRDTELLRPEERVAIAFVADNPGAWLYHCHMVEHHAAGMGGWFNVRA